MNSHFFYLKHAEDRGVALLFSLGVLSALMLLGVAFTNSTLFSRRIAEGRVNGNSAQLMARVVANQIAGAALYYYRNEIDGVSYDSYLPGADPVKAPEDYRAVFSIGNGADYSSAQDEYGEFLRGYTRGTGTRRYSKLDVGMRAPYAGEDSNAQWAYVRSNNGSNDVIIGRYAYQVLPKQSLNRINFYRTIRKGQKFQGKYPGDPRCNGSNADFSKSESSDENSDSSDPDADKNLFYSFKPPDARWGQDISEMDFVKLLTGSTDPIEKVPAYFSDIYASDICYGGRSNDDNVSRAWLESNFVEGTIPGVQECLQTSDGGRFRRFNLTAWKKDEDSDPDKENESGTGSGTEEDSDDVAWYARFDKKASEVQDFSGTDMNDFLDTLTAPAGLVPDGKSVKDIASRRAPATRQEGKYARDRQIITATASMDDSTLHPDPEMKAEKRGGLPFLRLIGASDHGAFGSLKDMRRQIAANFNDYCDADTVPTSDVKPEAWGQPDDPSSVPTYTGNEKTLYVNEVMLGWNPQIKLEVKDKTSDFQKDQKDLGKLVLAVELINVYKKNDDDTEDNNRLTPANYTLKTQLKPALAKETTDGSGDSGDSSGGDKVAGSLVMRLSYHVDYKKAGEDTATVYQEDKYDPEQSVTAYMTVSDPQDVTINNFDNKNNGYAIGYAAIPLSLDLKLPEVETIKTKYKESHSECETVTDIYVDGFKITRCELDCQLGNLILQNNTYGNVDYVNTHGAHISFKDSLSEPQKAEDYGTEEGPQFIIGNMEAIDPRQNLNVRVTTENDKQIVEERSDWRWGEVPSTASFDDNAYRTYNNERRSAAKTEEDVDTKKARWNAKNHVNLLTNPTLDALPGSMFSAVPTLDSDPAGDKNFEDLWKKCGGSKMVNFCSEPDYPLYANGRAMFPSNAAGKIDDMVSYRDKEIVTDPACRSVDPGDLEYPGYISTAVIRNAPMKSPWELGLVHRGIPFQTINLKKASTSVNNLSIPTKIDENPTGTSYSSGDGGILDWVKMTLSSHSDGKINLNEYVNRTRRDVYYNGTRVEFDDDPYNELDTKLLECLFADIPCESAYEFVKKTQKIDADGSSYSSGPKFDVGNISDNLYDSLHGHARFEQRSEVLNLNLTPEAETSTHLYSLNRATQQDDASQEAIIGRTINLLTAQSDPPTVFYAVIVAQTIQDLGGIGSSIQVVSSDHPDDSGPATLGTFDMGPPQSDPNDNVHYDIITGEAKILVTYEYNPVTGKIVIRDFENID